MARFAVCAARAAAIFAFVSNEETRPYLQGINIERGPDGGAILTATDGHALASWYDRAGYVDGEPIVSLRSVAKLCKPSKNDRFKTWLVGVDKRVAVIVCPAALEAEQALVCFESEQCEMLGGASSDAVIDGTFPDWRRVLPRERFTNDHQPVVGLASEVAGKVYSLAAAASKILMPEWKAITSKRKLGDHVPPVPSPHVGMMATPGFAACLAKIAYSDDILCLAMPFRNQAARVTVPDWAGGEPESIADAA